MNCIFAVADCNNFYVSCEQVFQPELRDKPTVVLSNNDGCVIARSPEAKAMGIAMGEPYFKVRQRMGPAWATGQNAVQVRSANFTLYGDMSRRVMDIIADNAPEIEIYSIDECFMDYTGAAFDVVEHARALRATLRQWTGLSVSIGLGPTKTLAKLANRKAKQDETGVYDVADLAVRNAALKDTAIEDVWGIGRCWSKRLKRHGLYTAHDLTIADRRWARNIMGVVGLCTIDELNGLSALAIEHSEPDKKTLCVSRSFGHTVSDRNALAERIHYFTVRAAEKLRQGDWVAGAVSVFVRGNAFRQDLPQYSNSTTIGLAIATSDTGPIVRAAQYALDRIYRSGIPYKKAGVLLLDLQPRASAPPSLFGAANPRRDHLMDVMDNLNRKFGSGAVSYGQIPQARTWYMNQHHRSPRYTTHWQELPMVK